MAAARTAERIARREATLALFAPPGTELYVVQVARAVGCSIGCAAWALERLQTEGLLVSTIVPSPRSGNGRRMYRKTPPTSGG